MLVTLLMILLCANVIGVIWKVGQSQILSISDH